MQTATKARFLRVIAATAVAVTFGPSPSIRVAASPDALSKLDPILQQRTSLLGRSSVVVRATSLGALSPVLGTVQLFGGHVLRTLPIINGVMLDVPNVLLRLIAGNPAVQHLSVDRPVFGAMERTGATIGATAVRQELGFDGAGVGVAVIDSGVTPWHDDLADATGALQRVDQFVDFVDGQTTPYDDYGHGTHVAGIIAGNGQDSAGARSGIAPGARLIELKVLDGSGQGRISDVIAALDYAVSHKDALNIRIVNLSVATGVYESYNDDPLTVAAQRAVSAGIVVVAAAGNNGRGPDGTTRYGGITAPGNAPWVLTVGASSHMGTADRSDDTMAAFSSRGPSAIDVGAKPDLVAPGVGIESLSNPASWMYGAYSADLLKGTAQTSYLPYLSLSGTSMSTPVVSGTVALMLQANPVLTPNAVKAILQYTAQVYPGYDALTQGAGFLNAKGAVELAAYLASPDATSYPVSTDWSASLIWGNQMMSGGRFTPDANAWSLNVTWGAPSAPDGSAVAWGLMCSSAACDEVSTQPWQRCPDGTCGSPAESGVAWNVVWGDMCQGADCPLSWTARTVSGTTDGESDTVVWGTSDGESDTVVWGTSCTDPSCQPVLWNHP